MEGLKILSTLNISLVPKLAFRKYDVLHYERSLLNYKNLLRSNN